MIIAPLPSTPNNPKFEFCGKEAKILLCGFDLTLREDAVASAMAHVKMLEKKKNYEYNYDDIFQFRLFGNLKLIMQKSH